MTADCPGLVVVTHMAASKRRFRPMEIDAARLNVAHAHCIFQRNLGAVALSVFVTDDHDVIELEERPGLRATARRFETIDGWAVERFGTIDILEVHHATRPT